MEALYQLSYSPRGTMNVTEAAAGSATVDQPSAVAAFGISSLRQSMRGTSV